MQYQSECLSALKSVVNIHKPFEKTFMDTMKLFMAIPDRINFLQLGRYGCFSEQTYRNLFENETFDWFAFNASIISKHLTGKFLFCLDIPGKKCPVSCYFICFCLAISCILGNSAMQNISLEKRIRDLHNRYPHILLIRLYQTEDISILNSKNYKALSICLFALSTADVSREAR